MPLYYFDVLRNGDTAIDAQGHELVDAQHAHKEAVRTLAEMGAEEIPKDGRLDLAVAVADERHRLLFKTSLRFEPGDVPDDADETMSQSTPGGSSMTLPNDPAFREPKGDHNRRIALGLDIDAFAVEAGVTPEALHTYEATGPDGDFDIYIAQLVGEALERLEANPPASQKVIT